MTPLSIAACSRSGTSPAEGVERDCPSLQAASSNNNAALARIIHNPLQSLRSYPPIEAACLSRMAGRASRLRAHPDRVLVAINRSEEHTSELQSLMRISYAVFCLKKKKNMSVW